MPTAIATIFLTFFLFLGGTAQSAGKLEELWYSVYENGQKVGHQLISYQKMPGGAKGLLKINCRLVIDNDSLISSYHLELNAHTVLEGDVVISHRIEVKEDDHDIIKGRASGDLTGYLIRQTYRGKQFERRILFKDFDCTDFSYPHKCFNQKGITSKTRLLDWETMEVIPTEIKYTKDTGFDTQNGEVSCMVIRYKSRKTERIDWVTPDGILLQSSGRNTRGSFLIKATSKRNALK